MFNVDEPMPRVKISFASDIYAFACVCYEVSRLSYPKHLSIDLPAKHKIFSRRLPFHEIPDQEIPSAVIKGMRPPRPNLLEDRIWDLIKEGWKQGADERPSAAAVVERISRFPEATHDAASWDYSAPRSLRSSLQGHDMKRSAKVHDHLIVFSYRHSYNSRKLGCIGVARAPFACCAAGRVLGGEFCRFAAHVNGRCGW
jgi:serine/threonine protein kinase